MAPTYNKEPGYMYDEAARFERNFAHLFTAVVPFTTDDTWYRHLREAISFLQNQPTWVSANPGELDAAARSEVRPMFDLTSLKTTREHKKLIPCCTVVSQSLGTV